MIQSFELCGARVAPMLKLSSRLVSDRYVRVTARAWGRPQLAVKSAGVVYDG